ncbi:MAG: hypothetical protein K2G64_02095 [Muribaculaceae bacterium]|nr:hypothetical protein [Muribaculaceae bacterium]MDE7393251.1 hypothetical protein [Muribaculaceae bacterium]
MINFQSIKRALLTTSVVAMLVGFLSGCESVDNDRIPPFNVYIPFNSQAEWITYGVSGAADYRIFHKNTRMPAGYPWSVQSASGYGGVLLCTDLSADPVAYDLSCPVECKQDIRIQVDTEAFNARCPVCGSTYDIFGANHGAPLSGPAAERHYGLQVYPVISNGATYRLVTR